ncbi:hypothetical protein F5884DRAFT_230958 [Xylogone sp. PMI_703]|nr:hypothetical protein F5884DRAFT_230958 [Xylogone sp. PMI_703]
MKKGATRDRFAPRLTSRPALVHRGSSHGPSQTSRTGRKSRKACAAVKLPLRAEGYLARVRSLFFPLSAASYLLLVLDAFHPVGGAGACRSVPYKVSTQYPFDNCQFIHPHASRQALDSPLALERISAVDIATLYTVYLSLLALLLCQSVNNSLAQLTHSRHQEADRG